MTPDRVLTIAIGRIDRDNNNLRTNDWTDATIQLSDAARKYGTVVFQGAGHGVTSDQDEEQAEESFVVIALMPDVTSDFLLKSEVSALLQRFNLSSACFAIDSAHVPAWAADLKEKS